MVIEWKEIARIKERMKKAKCDYKNALSGRQVWKGSPVTNFDLDKGVAYYFDDATSGANVRSFKHGPLRFVQFAIANSVISIGRAKPVSEAVNLLQNMPTPTDKRLEYLADRKLLSLSPVEIADVIDIYAYFLASYHDSEEKYRSGQTVTHFDRVEVSERLKALSKLLEGNLVVL